MFSLAVCRHPKAFPGQGFRPGDAWTNTVVPETFPLAVIVVPSTPRSPDTAKQAAAIPGLGTIETIPAALFAPKCRRNIYDEYQ
ncbi:hypothetical protein D3C81_1600640 [compost metagenome]